MAIFLVKDRDASCYDSKKDAMCYKKGDIVEVLNDDVSVVIPPAPPFWIIRANGIKKEDAIKYGDPETETRDLDGKVISTIIRRRIYKIDHDSLPTTIKESLSKDRYVEIVWSDLIKYITNKNQTARK